jgi:3(or 17)beta-hydroxysteroid dehydrogenase
MSSGFEEMVVLVTGAASGIGARTVERLAASGAHVVACDLRGLEQPRQNVDVFKFDVTDEQAWENASAQTLLRFGRLDGLVNCAGVIVMANVVDTSLSDFRRLMAINVEGTFLGMKYAMRAMLPKGEGSIVNVSSTGGIVGSPGVSAYSASKGAVRLMTKSVALEAIAAGSRIRVNSLHPSVTDTPMLDSIIEQLRGTTDRHQMRRAVPGGLLATADDIVDSILFLLSAQSRFINGTELVVDNGFTAQ